MKFQRSARWWFTHPTNLRRSFRVPCRRDWRPVFKRVHWWDLRKVFPSMRTHPWEPYAANSIAQHVTEDWRERIPSWEICVEAGMLPMSDAWHDFRLHVFHYLLPRFGLHWSLSWYQTPQVARLDRRRHSTLTQRIQILTDVLDHFIAALAELIAIHFASILCKLRNVLEKNWTNNSLKLLIEIFSSVSNSWIIAWIGKTTWKRLKQA